MKSLTVMFLLTGQMLCVEASFEKMFPPLQTDQEVNLTICTNRLLDGFTFYTHFAYSYDGLVIDHLARVLMNTRATNLKVNRPLERVKVTREFVTIVVDEKKDLVRYLLSVYAETFTLVNYFIIYLGMEPLEEIFEIIWLNKIAKVIVLDRFNDFYSYRPYKDGCNTVRPRLLYNCMVAEYRELVNIFNYEVKNLYGCPVKALALNNPPYVVNVSDQVVPGYETRMYKYAAKYLNFNLTFVEHNFTNWGFKEGGGNYTDILAEFQKDLNIDILFGRLPTSGNILADFTTTTTYFHHLITFYVPVARRIDPISNLFKVFDLKVLIIILIILFCMNLISFLLHLAKLLNENELHFLDIIGIGASQPIHPPNRPSLKVIYLTWVVYNFVLIASYNSAFTSVLTKPSYENQINSVEEILNAKLVIGGNIYAEPLIPKETKNFVLCLNNDTSKCILRVALERDMALIEDTQVVKYYEHKFRQTSLKKKIFGISGQHEHFIWAIVRRGHPLGKMINKAIMLFEENGLLDNWSSSFEVNAKKKVTGAFRILTLDHIRILLYVLAGGLLSSLVVFLWEIRRKLKMSAFQMI